MDIFNFKCKYCGGELSEIEGLKSLGKCKYCGSKQTLPKLENEKRANLFERANHLRRNNEFDKAEVLYEQLLNEDLTDPEAYWSLVLCRYGIEYVEDSRTKERIPTVNRTQMTSIFGDEDYKSAIAHASAEQKALYEAEAQTINEIQKGILDISRKEEPFDIFICYKETDESGRRSRDSILAQDLYHELTRDGYKVFFARVTLQGKLGSAYEPYIFSALNSSKVMVVLGTKKEHFEAVWVRNEWSRFLGQIKKGERKALIPAYRDMDAYDLPVEFSNLQAMDMSRLGFLQELVEGVETILKAYKKPSHEDKSASASNESKPKEEEKKYCEQCGTANDAASKFCSNCGHNKFVGINDIGELIKKKTQESSEEKRAIKCHICGSENIIGKSGGKCSTCSSFISWANEKKVKYCTECGNENDHNSVFCSKCGGKKFVNNISEYISYQERKKAAENAKNTYTTTQNNSTYQSTVNNTYSYQSRPQSSSSYSTKSYTNTSYKSSNASPKSGIIALLLCLFLAAFGAHYFYVGRKGMGILCICTLGFFGFVTIIGLIQIVTGKFKDKNGLIVSL